MKIAFAARISKNSQGGVRRVMDALAEGLRKRGHTVDVVLKENPPAWHDYLTYPLRLLFLVRASAWDVIITHSNDGLWCALASRFFCGYPKVIMHSHGWEEYAFKSWMEYGEKYGSGPTLKNRILARTLRHSQLYLNLCYARAAVFVSEADKNYVAEKRPRYSDRLFYIPNGYDPACFFPPPEGAPGKEYDLLFVGTWVRRKGNMFLLKILERVNREKPSLNICLTGHGLRKEQRQEIFKNIDPSRIHFIDNVSSMEMGDIYRKSRVLLHTSVYEGGLPCLTLIEAMACGVPVISFNYPGLDSFYKDRQNGILVNTGDWEGMYHAFDSLSEDSPGLERLSRNALEIITAFQWDHQAEKWNRLLQSGVLL